MLCALVAADPLVRRAGDVEKWWLRAERRRCGRKTAFWNITPVMFPPRQLACASSGSPLNGRSPAPAPNGRPLALRSTTPPTFFSNLILLFFPAFTVISSRGFPQPSCNHENGGRGMSQPTCGNCFFRFAALPACTQAAVETEALHFQ